MYPGFMSVLMPSGSQPTAMSGRTWMLRRTMIEIIKADPAYNNGNYADQPPSFALVAKFFSMATRSIGSVAARSDEWSAHPGTRQTAIFFLRCRSAGPAV
jgi:homoserine acetyltransferase